MQASEPTQSTTAAGLAALLGRTRLVPVITIHDAAYAVSLARALLSGGLPVIEITLRTDAGLEAIRRIAAEVPEAVVGAGTVTTPGQLRDARAAGASFIVSPGATDALLAAAEEEGGVFLPGAVTATELMRLLERGISVVKFFPAQASGGIAAIRALSAPFPQVRFCPTGGIDLELATRYLELSSVICVGGSWMVPDDLIGRGDWDGVSELAAAAAAATVGPGLPG